MRAKNEVERSISAAELKDFEKMKKENSKLEEDLKIKNKRVEELEREAKDMMSSFEANKRDKLSQNIKIKELQETIQ